MTFSGTAAQLNASLFIVPLDDVWYETDTAILQDNAFCYRFKIGTGALTYAALSYQPGCTKTPHAACRILPEPSDPCPDPPTPCAVLHGIDEDANLSSLWLCIPEFVRAYWLQQYCEGGEDVTIRTTDGLTTIDTATSGSNYDLPQSVIKYKDAANVDQITAPSNTNFEHPPYLNPALQIPRREVLLTGGSGTGIFSTAGRLIADTLPTIPQKLFATWGDGDAQTLGVTLPAAMQGVPLSFVSETGTSGTITVSVDGGTTFAAPPFTAGAAKVLFRRTTSTLTSTATFTTA